MKKCGFRGVQRGALCRSRRELSNAYFVATFRIDTAENDPCEVCRTHGASPTEIVRPGERTPSTLAARRGRDVQIDVRAAIVFCLRSEVNNFE